MVGYCMKRSILSLSITINVYAEHMNEGEMKHAKFGKVGLNNHVNLSPSNILQRAHQWATVLYEEVFGN